MKKRIIALMLILSHLTISTVWASSHAAEDADGGCGDCIGYESPHIHIGGHSHTEDDHEEEHNFASPDQAKQHLDEHHEHDEGHHVSLVFELGRFYQWQSTEHGQSERNTLRDGHYSDRTVAPPVPPPTA